MSERRPRRAVYRALIGGYEVLREEPLARQSALPFLCFTDDPDLTSDTWEVVHVDLRLPADSTRSARALKILGHPRLDEFDETLWVDNTVELLQAPDELFDQWLANADVAAPLHSYRASVLAEAEAVLDAGLDDFARVYEQLAHYVAQDRDSVEENPHWTGMVARRRTDHTERAMLAWWEDVLRYSRRDQLSFVPTMRANGIRLHSVPLDSFGSAWHAWPRAEGRDLRRVGSGLREALRPEASRVGVLQEELDRATEAMAHAISGRENVISGLQESLDEARTRADAAQAELGVVRHERDLAHIEVTRLTARVDALDDAVQRRTKKVRSLRRQLKRARAEAAPPARRHWTRRIWRR